MSPSELHGTYHRVHITGYISQGTYHRVHITGYGSTLYIGIAIYGFCILPIHLEIHFLLSVSSQFDFIAQNMSKIISVPNIS